MLKSECQHYDTFTDNTYGPSILIHDNGTTNMVMTHFHLHDEPKKFVNSMLKLPTIILFLTLFKDLFLRGYSDQKLYFIPIGCCISKLKQ